MPTIYKACITTEPDDSLSYSGPIMIEVDDEFYNSLSWDKTNRLDFTESKTVVMLCRTREIAEAYCNGVAMQYYMGKPDFWEKCKKLFEEKQKEEVNL